VLARLGYGFFAGTTLRQPTTQEIAGLITQTNLFYTDLFRAAYPNSFARFTVKNIVSTYDARRNLPFQFDFDANLVFNTNSNNTPTVAEIFRVMDNANLRDYIQMYVWESEPIGTTIFFDTKRVSFGELGQAL